LLVPGWGSKKGFRKNQKNEQRERGKVWKGRAGKQEPKSSDKRTTGPWKRGGLGGRGAKKSVEIPKKERKIRGKDPEVTGGGPKYTAGENVYKGREEGRSEVGQGFGD